MLRIDTHQHFWTYDPARYSWIGPTMAALQRNFTPADLEPELRAAGIEGTVAVEARGHLEETEQLLSIAERTPFVRGVVGWLPLTEPGVEGLLDRYLKRPQLCGLRHWLGSASDVDYMFGKELERGLSLLERTGLTYDLMLWPPQLGAVAALVDRHPNQIFVLDHFAKPFIRSAQLEPWRAQLCELARRPHVYCKVSGLTTEADWQSWRPQDLQPYLDAALEAFTPQRLMFGSDWPVCTLATSYARWAETIQSWTAALAPGEQERILGGTAVEVYRLR